MIFGRGDLSDRGFWVEKSRGRGTSLLGEMVMSWAWGLVGFHVASCLHTRRLLAPVQDVAVAAGKR